MSNLDYAKKALADNGFTLALYNGEELISSRLRGVKPLLELIDSGKDLSGFSAADKVVGKGAAYLYVLLRISGLHTGIISEPALDALNRFNIPVSYDLLVKNILNRTQTGLCPMESAVLDCDDPAGGEVLIRRRLAELTW